MPRGDGTGPQGQGSFTGKGLGANANQNRRSPIRGQGQTLRQRIRAGLGNVFGWGRAGHGLPQVDQKQRQSRRGGRGRKKKMDHEKNLNH